MRQILSREWLWFTLAALTGLLVFLFLYPRQHPDSVASFALTEEGAVSRSNFFLKDLGYNLEALTPRAQLRRYTRLLDSLQVDLGRPEAIRQLAEGGVEQVPAYYWEVTWQNVQKEALLVTRLTQNGRPWYLLNAGNVLPESPNLASSPDTLRVLAESLTKATSLPDSLIRAQARFYLEQTPMAQARFVLDSLKHAPSGRITCFFSGTHPLLEQHVAARLVLFHTGQLHTLEVSFNGISHSPTSPSTSSQDRPSLTLSFNELLGFLRAGLYFFLVLLAAFTLVQRLRARTVDFNVILRDSLLGGLALATFILNISLPSLLQNAPQSLVAILLIGLTGAGFGGGGGLLLLILVLGPTDSLLREKAPEKLEVLDQLRRGYVFSHQVGTALLRGLSLGLLGTGGFALLLSLFPAARIYLESSHFIHEVALSPFLSWLSFSLWYVPFVFFCVIFGVLFLGRWIQRPVLLIASFALLIMLLQVTPQEPRPPTYVFLISALGGIYFGWIYARYELVTLLVTGVSFFLITLAADGWLVEAAPFWLDTVSIYLLLGLSMLLGFIALRWGRTSSDIPPYVPEYIQELRKQERLQRELEIARQVQLSFLPQHMPSLPSLEISATCIPALEVGGDYYDFMISDDQRTLLTVIGDVSGKGIEAAFYMTLIKGMIQALGIELTRPRTILSRLNRLFYVHHRPGTFMSMTCARIDLQQLQLSFARAGHMPLLLARAATGKVTSLAPEGAAIGLLYSEEFEQILQEQTLPLQPGDTLLFYTDGITEARNPQGELLGDERLLELFTEYWHLPAREIVHHLIEEVYRFSESRTLYDDLTLVVLKPR